MGFKNYIVYESTSEFKSVALAALKGQWKTVFIIGFIYYLCINLPGVFIDYFLGVFQHAQEALNAIVSGMSPEEWVAQYANSFGVTSNVSLLYTMLVSGSFALGLTFIWLNILRRKPVNTEMVFTGFSYFIQSLLLYVFRTVCIFLWSLLFFIPGVIAYYRYSMAIFLLADNPKMNPVEAIRISGLLMKGNKLKLFTLDLSFIGWVLLTGIVAGIAFSPLMLLFSITTNIGMLIQTLGQTIVLAIAVPFVFAYRSVALAEFYKRVSAPFYRELASTSNYSSE